MVVSPQQVFGERIRALRLAAGVTQEDFAALCGMYRTYMSNIERGTANPTLSMIHVLAAALGVPVHTLFTDEEVAPVVKRPKGRTSRGRVSR